MKGVRQTHGPRSPGKAASGSVGVEMPVAGHFRGRLSGGSVRVGIRIWHGPPCDPVTGEELDRSWRWQAEVNGELFDDFDRVWPGCTGDPITEADYLTFCARAQWARQHAPESSYAITGRRRDPLSVSEPLPF